MIGLLRLEIPEWVIPIKKLIIFRNEETAGKLCRLKYPNHPKGCPKYGKDDKCPPKIKSIDNYIDLEKPIYIIYSEFDLESHVKNMKLKHPNWTKRQCKNVLYWQESSRKQLRKRIEWCNNVIDFNFVAYCPEGMNVNVYATCKLAGLKLQRIRNLKICHHIAIIGTKKGMNK